MKIDRIESNSNFGWLAMALVTAMALVAAPAPGGSGRTLRSGTISYRIRRVRPITRTRI